MRLLADENFPKPIVEALRAGGHDVQWARTDLAGASDVALLDLAESEARIVLTLDKDFWQIAVQRRSPLAQSGVVLFEFIQRLPRDSRRLWMLSPRRTQRGPAISASFQSTEFRWSRRAESEAPLRVVFSSQRTGEISAPVRFAHVSRLLTRPVCLPKPANQRVGATDDIIFVRIHLARAPELFSVSGSKLIDIRESAENRDGGGASLSKLFRMNHFASVSAPSNTLCLTWGANSFSHSFHRALSPPNAAKSFQVRILAGPRGETPERSVWLSRQLTGVFAVV